MCLFWIRRYRPLRAARGGPALRFCVATPRKQRRHAGMQHDATRTTQRPPPQPRAYGCLRPALPSPTTPPTTSRALPSPRGTGRPATHRRRRLLRAIADDTKVRWIRQRPVACDARSIRTSPSRIISISSSLRPATVSVRRVRLVPAIETGRPLD